MSMWYLGTHKAIPKLVQAGLATAEVAQVNLLQPVPVQLSQEHGQVVVAEGVKTRLEWEHSLKFRQDMSTCLGLSCPTPPPHLTQTIGRFPDNRLGGGGSTRNGVMEVRGPMVMAERVYLGGV